MSQREVQRLLHRLELNEGGRQYPRTYPLVYFEWVWRLFEELPEPDRKDPDGATAYREHLDGRPTRATLTQLGRAFAFLRSALEPYSLSKQPEP